MNLTVNMSDPKDMATAITFLQMMINGGTMRANVPQEAESVLEPAEDGLDDLLGDGTQDSDNLDSLIEQEPLPPAIPTNADIKAAIQAAVDAKGKEATNAFLKKVMESLTVKKLSDIPDEKKANFITVLAAFSKKK